MQAKLSGNLNTMLVVLVPADANSDKKPDIVCPTCRTGYTFRWLDRDREQIDGHYIFECSCEANYCLAVKTVTTYSLDVYPVW